MLERVIYYYYCYYYLVHESPQRKRQDHELRRYAKFSLVSVLEQLVQNLKCHTESYLAMYSFQGLCFLQFRRAIL